jgi:hypothetical protein
MKLYEGENGTYTQSKISRDFPTISPVGIEDEDFPPEPQTSIRKDE